MSFCAYTVYGQDLGLGFPHVHTLLLLLLYKYAASYRKYLGKF